MNKKNIRYIIGFISIIYIIYMWSSKNITSVNFSFPMIFTSFGVTLIKVLILAGIIYTVKLLLSKRK